MLEMSAMIVINSLYEDRALLELVNQKHIDNISKDRSQLMHELTQHLFTVTLE